MFKRAAVCLVWLTGCASATPPSYLVATTRHVETRALPPDPGTEALPAAVPTGDWVEAVEPGSCLDAQGRPAVDAPRPCPARPGIAVSEARAARDGLYRIRYRELRLVYESDRDVWGAQRELYEGQLRRADSHIQSLQPTWFQQNAFAFGLGGGIVLGAATIVSIFAVTSRP